MEFFHDFRWTFCIKKGSVYHCQSFPAVYSQSGSFVSRVAIIRPPPKTSLHFYSCCVRPHSSGDKCALYMAKSSVIVITLWVPIASFTTGVNNVQSTVISSMVWAFARVTQTECCTASSQNVTGSRPDLTLIFLSIMITLYCSSRFIFHSVDDSFAQVKSLWRQANIERLNTL